MKASFDTVKMSFSLEEMKELRNQFIALMADMASAEQMLGGQTSEEFVRTRYPKINEIIEVLNLNEQLPF